MFKTMRPSPARLKMYGKQNTPLFPPLAALCDFYSDILNAGTNCANVHSEFKYSLLVSFRVRTYPYSLSQAYALTRRISKWCAYVLVRGVSLLAFPDFSKSRGLGLSLPTTMCECTVNSKDW